MPIQHRIDARQNLILIESWDTLTDEELLDYRRALNQDRRLVEMDRLFWTGAGLAMTGEAPQGRTATWPSV